MTNNQRKINKLKSQPQIVAGILPNDHNIEFAGVKDTKQVLWLQNGNTHYFNDLPTMYYELLKASYLKDTKAVEYLSVLTNDEKRQVELYTYYMYGDLDSTPDIVDGKLNEPENFRDMENCPSLAWNKEITIDGTPLTHREILIADLMIGVGLDKVAHEKVGVSLSHYDKLKRDLFKKAGVTNKTDFVLKAAVQKVIRIDL